MNPNVGPNAPMANGDAAALVQAAQATAAQNGLIFQNGQWWYQTPSGNWEYYRGDQWNTFRGSAGIGIPAGGFSPASTAPASTLTPAASPTYTYEVPAYYSP
jgi:hypothetical protein